MNNLLVMGLLIITCMAWLGWFWRGIGYRGGFAGAGVPVGPLLLTILCVVILK
jgi:hypothetical protein